MGNCAEINPPESPAARVLFRAWFGDQRQTYDLQAEQAICKQLADLPLALELVSRCIAWYHLAPQQVLNQLESLGRRFVTNSNSAVHTALAFCINQLAPEAARLLNLIGLIPAGPFGWEVIGAVSDVDVQAHLPVLLGLGLVRFDKLLGYYPSSALVDTRALPIDADLEREVGVRRRILWSLISPQTPGTLKALNACVRFLSWLIKDYSQQGVSTQMITSVQMAIPFLKASGLWADLAKALACGKRCSSRVV